MKKTIILFLSLAIAVVVILYSEINTIKGGASIGGLIAGSIIPYLITSVVDLTDNTNWKVSQRKLERAGILQPDTAIRISFAYLFRIKVDGKYFLVKNNRTNKYQPVGGAYKFYENEAVFLVNKFSVENDDRIPINNVTKHDYRLLVKNKFLRQFVCRFDETNDREAIADVSREFIEEIFTSDLIDKSDFGDLTYKYCGRHMTDVEYGNVFFHYELLLADIIEVCLTNIQEQLFRNLMKVQHENYYFASPEEIKSLGVKHGTNELQDIIANHSFKILTENTDMLKNQNKYNNKIHVSIK